VDITNLLGYDITITNLTAEVTAGTPTKHFWFPYARAWFGNFTLLNVDTLDPWRPGPAPFDECNYYTGEVTVVQDGDWVAMAVGTPYPEPVDGPRSLVEPDWEGDAEATGHVAPIKLKNGSTLTEYFGIVIFGDVDPGTQINGTITLSLTYRIGGPPIISILSPENKMYPVNDVPLTFTVDEPTDWIGYSLDGQANVTITENATLLGLPDGLHYVVVYANDTTGDMGLSSMVYFTVDTTPPNITQVSQTPLENNVLPEDEVIISATVTDALSKVKQVTLNYTNGNGTWITVDMINLMGNIWTAIIPEFPYGTNVTYIIVAKDDMNNTITTEDLGYEYQYQVIPEFPTWPSILLLILLTVAIAITKQRLPKHQQCLSH
jgi:hypothetical protein